METPHQARQSKPAATDFSRRSAAPRTTEGQGERYDEASGLSEPGLARPGVDCLNRVACTKVRTTAHFMCAGKPIHSSVLTHARVFPSTAAKVDISRVSSNLSDRSSDSDEKYSRSGVKSLLLTSRCRGVVVGRRTLCMYGCFVDGKTGFWYAFEQISERDAVRFSGRSF